jgi:hypothetical protein
LGLMAAVWTRRENKEEKAERARLEAERKTSKTTEEVVASIGEIRTEREALQEFERIEDDGTGIVPWIASITKLTRGLSRALTPEARGQLAWKIASLKMAFQEENEEAVKQLSAELTYYFALLAPLMPETKKPDVYFMPYIQKPGGNVPPQNSGIP